jgi:hypothetical protein
MTKSASFYLVGLALFSALTSFMFIYYGIGILFRAGLSQPMTVFAYVTAGYGLANIYLLSFAWRARVQWAITANQLIALCYLGIFVFDRINAGVRGTGLIGIAVVAGVLALNWLAVKKLVQRGR